MIKEIKMPDLGTTVEEIKIIRWIKGEGDKIARGEPLLEVETDKTTLEVESYLAGTLKQIVVKAEEIALAGDTIALVEV